MRNTAKKYSAQVWCYVDVWTSCDDDNALHCRRFDTHKWCVRLVDDMADDMAGPLLAHSHLWPSLCVSNWFGKSFQFLRHIAYWYTFTTNPSGCQTDWMVICLFARPLAELIQPHILCVTTNQTYSYGTDSWRLWYDSASAALRTIFSSKLQRQQMAGRSVEDKCEKSLWCTWRKLDAVMSSAFHNIHCTWYTQIRHRVAARICGKHIPNVIPGNRRIYRKNWHTKDIQCQYNRLLLDAFECVALLFTSNFDPLLYVIYFTWTHVLCVLLSHSTRIAPILENQYRDGCVNDLCLLRRSLQNITRTHWWMNCNFGSPQILLHRSSIIFRFVAFYRQQ